MNDPGAERGAQAPCVRRPLAVLMSRFPLLTETFILREMVELERQGQPVRLVPLLREAPAVVHPEAEAWSARALFTPLLSVGILGANARAFRRAPLRYLGLAVRVLARSASSPNLCLRTAALLPKSVYLAERLGAEGVGHAHAHFATHPATAALVVSALAGVPFSFTVHAHDIFVRRALLGEKLRRSRFVRAVSRFNRDFLSARYAGAADKIHVIHVGVDPAAYAGSSDAPTTARLLCVAALRPYKGVAVLVEACRRLRDEGVVFVCDLVGDGPLRARLERRVAAAGLDGFVRVLGARRQDEVARLLARASVFVHPSVVAPDGQMDGIPVALMEAMAAGRPVVASALSGIPELVEDGTSGLLVPPGDDAALAAAVRRLILDPGLRRRLGAGGRCKVEREFALAACARELIEKIDAESLAVDPQWAAHIGSAAWPELAGRRIGLRRIHESREASAAELLVADGHKVRELVLKRHKPFAGESRPPAERARREMEALARLQRGLGEERGVARSGRCGVPKPLRFDEPTASILMEACAGVSLAALVRERRDQGGRDTALISALRRTGRWLRLFQRRTARAGGARPALDALVARAHQDLEACAAAGRLARGLARPLAMRLDELSRQAEPHALRLVEHHGDFWAGNVFVDGETVEVIDFEGWRDGLPYEDAAYFLVQLELFSAYPWLRRQRRRLASAFLEGYLCADILGPAAWKLCRLAEALRVLRPAEPAASVHAFRLWWRRRVLGAVLRESLR